MAATNPTFKFPDNTIFHGIAGDPRGFTYGDFKALTDDKEKFWHLKKRLDDYLFNSIRDISHPFTKASLTCVGCDVLGQILYGISNVFNPGPTNTIKIIEALDDTNKLRGPINVTSTFYSSFQNATHNNDDNIPGSLKAAQNPHYSNFLYHGLRNQYIHSYRPYGVLLSDQQEVFFEIIETKGSMIVNPSKFWEKFQTFYERVFFKLISGTSAPDDEVNPKRYLEYIV